ncbi:13573_t:CDS:2, partial [Ambispora gerdemannii]
TTIQMLTRRIEVMETTRPYQNNNENRNRNWNRTNSNSRIICYNCGEQGHISINCEKPKQNNNYRDNSGGNRPNQNNANSFPQNNVRPNLDRPVINDNTGSKNTNINNVLLAQLQELTNNLQNMVKNQPSNDTNSLLATHEYLASDKKQKGVDRHEPYVKQHNTRSRRTEAEDKVGNPIVNDDDGGVNDDEEMIEIDA